MIQGKVDEWGHITNTPGETIEVRRTDVDTDPDSYCSTGLHVGSFNYANGFASTYMGDKVLLVEVDPMDVVSVPRDCDGEKCRCSKYKVLHEIERPTSELELFDDEMFDEDTIEERLNDLEGGDVGTAYATMINVENYLWTKESLERNISRTGETTVRQLVGSTGRKFGASTAEIIRLCIYFGYDIKLVGNNFGNAIVSL